jgi:hypothetical protein
MHAHLEVGRFPCIRPHRAIRFLHQLGLSFFATWLLQCEHRLHLDTGWQPCHSAATISSTACSPCPAAVVCSGCGGCALRLDRLEGRLVSGCYFRRRLQATVLATTV